MTAMEKEKPVGFSNCLGSIELAEIELVPT